MAESFGELSYEGEGGSGEPDIKVVRIRKKVPCVGQPLSDDEICETPPSCTDTSTSTGNILHRIIYDPSRHREPQLRQWPAIYPRTEEIETNNPHQYKASLKANNIDQMCALRISSEPNPFRLPAIVATLGPASNSVEHILELLEAGINIARVNMAHADPCRRAAIFQNIIEAANRYSASVDYTIPIATIMDLKGPEIRTGRIDVAFLKDPLVPELMLKKGRIVRLSSDSIFENRCTEKIVYIDCEVLSIHIQPGMEVLIGDGEIRLRVLAIESFHIVCRVEDEGTLRNYQQIHVPVLPLPLPTITSCDYESLALAIEQEVDIVVVPKVRNDSVIYQVKNILEEKSPQSKILVFAKISNYEGLQRIDNILAAADGIILHRDDLGLEIPSSKLFIAQKQVIARCNKLGKPIICPASLIGRQHQDALSLAQCIVDGVDCLMLVEETANTCEAADYVSQLNDIIREAEAATMQYPFCYDLAKMLIPSIEPCMAIALAAVEISTKVRAGAILTITTSGRTAQLLSWFRPRCPIIAVSRIGRTARQLNAWKSVVPLSYSGPPLNDWFEDCGARIRYGIGFGRDRGMIKPGDALILVTGYRKNAGFTNCIRIVFASVEDGQFVDNAEQYFAAVN